MGPSGVIWKFLNSAFGLWLLSSVVIAAFLSTASQEEKCSSTAISIIPKIAKSASERDLRVVAIITALHANKPSPEIEATIKGIITGSTFFYRDYKGTSLLDLEFNLYESTLQTYFLGLEKTPEPSDFSNRELTVAEILGLISSNPMDQQRVMDKLRNASSELTSMEKILSDQGQLADFPFVLRRTAKSLDVAFEKIPCQPFYLIRNRITQYFRGLK